MPGYPITYGAYGDPAASAPHNYPYGETYNANTCVGVDYDTDPCLAKSALRVIVEESNAEMEEMNNKR